MVVEHILILIPLIFHINVPRDILALKICTFFLNLSAEVSSVLFFCFSNFIQQKMSEWKRNYFIMKIQTFIVYPSRFGLFNRFHLHQIVYLFCSIFFCLLSKQYSCSVESLSECASKSIPGVFFFNPLCFLSIKKSL